jgi:hypothetical protein
VTDGNGAAAIRFMLMVVGARPRLARSESE